jgi:gliding motility-associated-like protein
MAGPDIDLGCIDLNNLEHQIDGNVIVSGIFSYNWTALNGGQIKAQNEDVEDPIITAPGTYILTIETPKCTASDTVEVFASTPPVVEVEPVDILGCTNSTTQLNAGNSQIGENQIGFWTTDIGHFVSDSTSVTPVVDQEGTYTFTILDTLNGCKSSANVLVQVNTAKPKADAGQDRQLGCEDPFITLSGLSSSSGTGIAYEWSTPDGSSIVNFDKIEADVSRVGTYILKVTNLINGCQATDTMMVLADESLPVARIGKEAFIGCGMDEVTLDATNSSQGRSFKYRWETSGQFLSDTNFITTQDAGQFLFIVTNIDNDDCIADTARIDVKIDKNAPESSITQQLTLGCKSECTDLSANIPAEGQEFFTYQWTTDDGLICEGENMPTAKVSSVALYKFIITDTRNNCSDTSSAIVAGDASSIISDAGPSRIIGCDRDPVLLDGRGSTVNDNTTITWTDEAGTVISDQITAEVNQPGTYLLTIVDKVTDCNASNKVEVTLDTMPPLANAGEDLILEGCEFPNSLRLNGSLSESGPGISYAWVAPLGGKLTGDSTSISPAIGGPGIYQLTVTNNNTGCSSTDEVQIQSKLNIPSPNGGPDRTLSCDEPMTTLAGLSGLPSGNATIKWSTQDGNIVGVDDQLSLQVDAAGTYVLSITSQDGCTSTDEVVVTADLDMPNADAGAPLTISCNENTLLNGSGSTGPNLEISWTTTNGNIVSGADTYTPEVNLGGTYTLTVSNLDNNCKTTSEVLITADDPLPLAVAGDNQEICGNETSLSATPVDANIQGKWSTLEKSIILSESDPNTSVADLVEGANTYIWTLSTDKCPDYSSDTVRVTVPGFPVATDDAFEIVNGQNTPTLNLIANDIINFEAYNVNIVVQPTTGELMKESEGQYTFSTPARFYGTQEFQYEVCSAICSELCDQASVRVVVLPSDDVDTTNSLPNAITPNGDGLNDMLIFDELIFDASSFPKSELVIFNRWGDVVYKASPYNNDWGGKTTNGDVLPEGTYYFVLRLDIAEGEGMKGDVTILR